MAPAATKRFSANGVADLAHEARVGHLLRRAYYMAREQSSAAQRELDLTPRQGAAILSLSYNVSMSQAELGEAIGMEPANVHGLVDRLKKKDLINAVRDPDNPRRMRVSLSEKGKDLVQPVSDSALHSEEMTLAKLSERERVQLVELLRKLVA